MKKAAYLIFGLSLILLLISMAWLLFGDIEEREIYASVNVGERVGFDLNATALTFGNIPKPGSSSRSIIFNNTYGFPVLLSISSEGNISSLIEYENKIKVEPGEEYKVGFSVHSDLSTPAGDYTGIVRIKVRPSLD